MSPCFLVFYVVSVFIYFFTAFIFSSAWLCQHSLYYGTLSFVCRPLSVVPPSAVRVAISSEHIWQIYFKFQLLLALGHAPRLSSDLETKNAFSNFSRFFFSFSLTWDPVGAKTWKRYSSLKSRLNDSKLLMNFLLGGPHKRTVLEFWNFEFAIFNNFLTFKFTIVPYGKTKTAIIWNMWDRRAKRGEIWDSRVLVYMVYLVPCNVQCHLESLVQLLVLIIGPNVPNVNGYEKTFGKAVRAKPIISPVAENAVLAARFWSI